MVPSLEKLAKSLARLRRFKAQDRARELLPGERVATCFRRPGFDPVTRQQYDHVGIKQSQKQGHLYASNLRPCHDRWACPNCQWLWSCRYLDRMLTAMTRPENLRRYTYALQTLTVGHKSFMPPGEVLAKFKKAHHLFHSGRWYQAFKARWHIRGMFTAMDSLYTENGFHPHTHSLVVADRKPFWIDRPDGTQEAIMQHFTPEILAEMFAEAAKRWSECAAKAGIYASVEHGYSIEHQEGTGPEAIAGYLLKMASEVTLAPAKRGGEEGKTLIEVLEDPELAEVWIGIVHALKGTALIRASHGLWKLLGADEPTDADLNAPEGEADDRLLAKLYKVAWYELLRQGRRQEFFEKLAEGIDQLAPWCKEHCFELELVEPEEQ